MKYAKLMDGILEYAPERMGNVIGYNSPNNDAQLRADGYKIVVVDETMPESTYPLRLVYAETEDSLVGTYEIIYPELPDRKVQRRAEVNRLRDEKLSDYFVYDGSAFDADADSVMSLMVASQDAQTRLAAGEAVSKGWTLYDNTERTMTGEDWILVVPAMHAWRSAVHEHASFLKACVDACTNLADLEELDVSEDWPVPENV